MVHGKNRIPYWIDRRLTGLAGREYHATISFGLPFEPEDSQYEKSRLRGLPAIMDDTHANKMITAADIAQLRAIYAVHDSSDH